MTGRVGNILCGRPWRMALAVIGLCLAVIFGPTVEPLHAMEVSNPSMTATVAELAVDGAHAPSSPEQAIHCLAHCAAHGVAAPAPAETDGILSASGPCYGQIAAVAPVEVRSAPPTRPPSA